MKLLGSLMLLTCGLVLLHRVFTRRRLQIPYATSSIPIIGVTLEFSHDPIKYLRRQRKLHGDVFCLDFVVFRMVVFASVAGNTALVRRAENELSMSIIMKERLGEKWAASLNFKDWEQIWHPGQTKNFNALTTMANLGSMGPFLNVILRSRFQELADTGAFRLFESMSNLVSSANVYTFLGRQLYESHGDEICRLILRLEELLASKALQVLPHGWHPNGWELRRIYHRLDEILLPELERRRAAEEAVPGTGLSTDYFSYLIKHLGWEYVPVMSVHISFMLFAAHTNVARTFSWVIAHMLSTPEVYDRIRESIRTEDDKYWEYCIRETGRCYTNLFLMRKIARGFNSQPEGGVMLPEGENVVVSPLLVSRDENIWEHADCWLPERFSAKALARHSRRYEYIQFGGGVHSCKGEKVAWWLMKAMFAIVDEDYQWEPVEGIKLWESAKTPASEDYLINNMRRSLGHDGVGLEPEWLGKNLGTPYAKKDPLVRLVRRTPKLDELVS